MITDNFFMLAGLTLSAEMRWFETVPAAGDGCSVLMRTTKSQTCQRTSAFSLPPTRAQRALASGAWVAPCCALNDIGLAYLARLQLADREECLQVESGRIPQIEEHATEQEIAEIAEQNELSA